MEFKIYDKDFGDDDYIGEGKIDLGIVFQRRQVSEWFNVVRTKSGKNKKKKKKDGGGSKGKSAGQIMFVLEFQPTQMGQMGYPP